MKNPFKAQTGLVDAQAIQATIRRALASAGLDSTTGPMHGVTETIRRALAAAGLERAEPGPAPAPSRAPSGAEAPPQPGRFETHVYTNEAGTRAYKVHLPPGPAEAARPVVVMLHGCTQSADDFAAGTQMNRLADRHGFIVVYPEQDAQANASKCWNWFSPRDQSRAAGEPSIIAGLVGEVARRHDADPRRIFVAGLSAGAAMAVVLGETYPELFAAVGVHSGLAYGSAHDIPSALAAMKGGRSGLPGLQNAGPRGKAVQPVPVIVFHGDRDHTVQPSNAAQIVQQARDAFADQASTGALRASSESGAAPGGGRYTRTLHTDGDGRTRIEHWTLHGAGHAWSGGDASGSYTDGSGPDASAEMARFFLAQPRAGSA